MNPNTIVYLVDKTTHQVSYSGRVPPTYDNITGLDAVEYNDVRDLSWAGKPNLGFLTFDDALNQQIPVQTLEMMKKVAIDIEWSRLEPIRSDLIDEQRWRVDRYNDEVTLNITKSEDIRPVLVYMQLIRDLKTAFSNPFDIVWPVVPPTPTRL